MGRLDEIDLSKTMQQESATAMAHELWCDGSAYFAVIVNSNIHFETASLSDPKVIAGRFSIRRVEPAEIDRNS